MSGRVLWRKAESVGVDPVPGQLGYTPQAKALEVTAQRINGLQRQVMELEELNASQRMDHHKAALKLSTKTKELTKNLATSEALVAEQKEIIEGLRRELNAAKEELATKTDRLEIATDNQTNLQKQVDALEGALATSNQTLARQEQLLAQYQIAVRIQSEIDSRMKVLIGSSVAFGGAVSFFLSPFVGYGVYCTTVLGGMITPDMREKRRNLQVALDCCNRLRTELVSASKTPS